MTEDQPAPEPKPGRKREPIAAWIGLALGVIVALALLWSAGEQSYQSCLAAVDAKYGNSTDKLSLLARRREVETCSRSPF